ncbi:LolA family protein [Vibrio litoralis]|uniref:LolA family protein n=1 Tax=Vibrio litoralis TaxID=335972 RepID=UPI00041E15C3|nr:outer membrane lipoprotein carrier protein LolA [Vibrio litoralis]
MNIILKPFVLGYKITWKAIYGLVLLLCALLFLTQTSQAATGDNDKLAQLQQQLASHQVVRGDFTQTRHMQMFDAPLISQGQFLLSSQYGLWWQQTTPFPTSLVLTQDTLSQQVGSEPAQVVKVADNPMVFYFSHVFLSLFKGDTQTLQQQFDLKLSSNQSNQWVLSLTPKLAPLNKVFSQINIEANDYINRIELIEIRGDRTDIEFSKQTHQPSDLSTAEQAIFGQ